MATKERSTRERPTRGKFFVSSRRRWESVVEGVLRHGVQQGKVVEIDKERRMIPDPYYLEFNQAELAALEHEAAKIDVVLDEVENEHLGGGVWKFTGGAAFATSEFSGKLKFFADAFRHINEKVVTPTALCARRTDYFATEADMVKTDRKHHVWRFTSGSAPGIEVSFLELYQFVRHFFYTNIRDDDERDKKQIQLMRTLEENANVVMQPNYEAFMATRGGVR